MKYSFLSAFVLTFTLLFYQCDSPVITPKPRGYPKVELPERGYQTFTESFCNLTFEYPKYAKIEQDQYFFGDAAPNSCWFDVIFPSFKARLHCSYVPIDEENTAVTLQQEAFKMTDWHNKRASFIEESFFENEHNAVGMTFDVEGPVASPFQFYLTDGLQQKHFLRGAFYFDTQVQPDSLAPVITFIKKDLEKMLNTFQWN